MCAMRYTGGKAKSNTSQSISYHCEGDPWQTQNTDVADSPEPMYHQIISSYLDNKSVTDTAANAKSSMTKKTSPAYRASKEETIPINKLAFLQNDILQAILLKREKKKKGGAHN